LLNSISLFSKNGTGTNVTGNNGSGNNVTGNNGTDKNGTCSILGFEVGLGVKDAGLRVRVWENLTSVCHFAYFSICVLITCAIFN